MFKVHHYLSWDGIDGGEWLRESVFSLEKSEAAEMLAMSSCNTLKDKDKRSRRHSVGIFIGAFPCGIVPFFDEIFGSECTSQTYGIIIEYLSQLSKVKRQQLTHFLYDDMCHLKAS